LSIDEAYDFLRSEPLPVVGVSSSGKNFGAVAFRTLLGMGYDVVPINPKMSQFEGKKCYPNLSALENAPESVILVIPPENASPVLKECARLGVNKVWFQPGSESAEAIKFCRDNQITAYTKFCILLFCGNFPHNLHLFILKLFNKIS
jgi:predicted CoA-binding protein